MSKNDGGSRTQTIKSRLFSLDFIRALATILIVVTHFNNPYLIEGDRYLFVNEPFGIYIGNLGVSLFLIISGVALTITYKRPLNLAQFYWKRAKGIYPMFWTAWLMATLYLFVSRDGFPPNAGPAKSLIYTILGIDGLAANFQVRTMYILGEWFLGFILIFYLIFPFLLWATDTFPKITALLAIVIYAVALYLLQGFWVPAAVLLPVRLPELLFGIYIARYIRVIPRWVILPAAAVITLSTIYPTEIPEDIATTAVGIAVFLVMIVVGQYLDVSVIREPVAFIATYSYPIFLVHHVVISELFESVPTQDFLPLQLIVMFIVVCVVTVTLAIALDRLTRHLVAFATRCFQPSMRT